MASSYKQGNRFLGKESNYYVSEKKKREGNEETWKKKVKNIFRIVGE